MNVPPMMEEPEQMERPLPRRRYPWAMMVVAATFVLAAFLSWYGSWFGRPLSDQQIETYLADREKPRHVQHALSQIATRIIEGDESVRKFYPAVIAASKHEAPEVRLTAAWAMGQDNGHQEFHHALLSMLSDENVGVRQNVALALVRFNDHAGHSEIVAMLAPKTLKADKGGIVDVIVEEEGAAVASGAPLVRITGNDGQSSEVRAPRDGRLEAVLVADGDRIEPGGDLITLAPSTEQAWEALRALYLIGQPEDLSAIERYTRPLPGMPDRVREQARLTMEAIRGRSQ